MKKFLCLLGAVAFVFTSCSKDDNDSSDPTSSVLVKKIIDVRSNGESYTRLVTYNGNKITSIAEEDGYLTKYYYTGNLITKIEEIDETGVIEHTTDYEYSGDKLISLTDKAPDAVYSYKTKFVYNSDGTVSFDEFRINVSTGVEQEYGEVGKFTFKDGNLVKKETSYYGYDYLTVYEYDNNHNPFKNITGFNSLLDEATVNNVIKQTQTSGSGADLHTSETTYTYKYDANNYPIEKIVKYSGSTSTETTKYTY